MFIFIQKIYITIKEKYDPSLDHFASFYFLSKPVIFLLIYVILTISEAYGADGHHLKMKPSLFFFTTLDGTHVYHGM